MEVLNPLGVSGDLAPKILLLALLKVVSVDLGPELSGASAAVEVPNVDGTTEDPNLKVAPAETVGELDG